SLFQGEFDFTRARGFILRVSAGVDLKTGIATWLLQAIDPLTGEVLRDPTKGLLRPNNAQGQGAGFVTYTVVPVENPTPGAPITATARVIADNAPPEDTEPLVYRIDGKAPTTTLDATPVAGTNDYHLRYSVVDDDGGSGVRHVTLYVAEDGGDFKIWKRQVQSTAGEEVYLGRPGHTYQFLAL